jgi:hypothetical protein
MGVFYSMCGLIVVKLLPIITSSSMALKVVGKEYPTAGAVRLRREPGESGDSCLGTEYVAWSV